MRRACGFTLVEVLVALLILAVMAGLSWRGIDTMLRSRDISQAQLDRSARLHTVMGQWQQDLEQVQEAAGIPALRFDGLHLYLTRRQPTGLQVVVWWLGEGKLLRWASEPVTQLQDLRRVYDEAQQPLVVGARALEALEGVAGWQMAYYFGNAWTNAQSSGDLAETLAEAEKRSRSVTQPAGSASEVQPVGPQRAVLPKAVRVQLEFTPSPGNFSGPLVRQVMLGSSG